MGADALVARRVARRHGNTAAVRLLWQKAFPMHYACSKGEAEVVEAWLRAGSIDVNACDWKGRTLLHEASRGGHALLVRTLLGAQARVDAFVHRVADLTARHGSTRGNGRPGPSSNAGGGSKLWRVAASELTSEATAARS